VTEAPLLPPPGYADLELCGRGATSQVYRALDRKSGQLVALKCLHRQLVRSEESLTRLGRELEALNRLRHAGIVPVRGLIKWRGAPTIVMDYVDGVDLEARLAQGRPPPAEVERIARALLDILSAAHAAGIVHRDVKPHNVRLAGDGRIFLLDFGSARLDAASTLSTAGTTVGTPDYMAPELFAGSVYDPRVDLYGLGATLFQCLSGSVPLAAESLSELAYRRATEDAPPIRELAGDCGEALAQVIDRCLARAPEARYPSAARALWALDHPEEERVFALRRSRHPPCLGCDRPVPPELAACPSCRRQRPFGFDPGRRHVDLVSVSDPTALVRALAGMFPEMATPHRAQALCEALAVLSVGGKPIRLASFISDRDAERLAARLAEAGARTKLRIESRAKVLQAVIPFFLLGTILTGSAGLGLIAGGLAGLLAVLAESVTRNKSVLGGTVLKIPLSLSAAACSAGALKTWIGGAQLGAGAATLAGLGLTAPILCGALSRGRRTAIAPAETPEPRWLEKVGTFFRSKASLAQVHGVGLPDRAMAATMAAVALFALIPLELSILYSIQSSPVIAAVTFTRPAASPSPRPAPAADPDHPRGPAARSSVQRTPRPLPIREGLLGGSVLLGSLAIGLTLRRRRQVRELEARLFAELDHREIAALAERIAPLDRRARGDLPHAIVDHGDGFLLAALKEASELTGALGAGETRSLWASLEALADERAAVSRDARALEARCILETDPAQQLRFEILRAAGELEAVVAARWSKR
jgi:tRNA A-37 threonylcarbamoyl transferase component Bud32